MIKLFLKPVFVLIFSLAPTQAYGLDKYTEEIIKQIGMFQNILTAYDSDELIYDPNDFEHGRILFDAIGLRFKNSFGQREVYKNEILEKINHFDRFELGHKLAAALESKGYCAAGICGKTYSTPSLDQNPEKETGSVFIEALGLDLRKENKTAQVYYGLHVLLNSTVALSRSGSYMCSGFAASKRVIFTAAHCLCAGGRLNRFHRVFWGNNIVDGPPKARTIPLQNHKRGWDSKYLMYYDLQYSDSSDNFCERNDITIGDIAAIILHSNSEKITDLQNFTPWGAMRGDAMYRKDSADYFAAGFGVTSGQGNVGKKNFAAFKIGNIESNDNGIDEYHAFGKIDRVDTCNGDSGGPLFMIYEGRISILGVTSRPISSGSSGCGKGGIYVNAALIRYMQGRDNLLYHALRE